VLPGRTRKSGAQDLPLLGEALHVGGHQVRHLPPGVEDARVFQEGVQQRQAQLRTVDQGEAQRFDAGAELPRIAGRQGREIGLPP
jgi:hypothetical protein